MKSKFLERFRSSIENKASIYSTSSPINKHLNPLQVHHNDSASESVDSDYQAARPKEIRAKMLTILRKKAHSPFPLEYSSPQPVKCLPHIKSSMVSSNSTARSRKVSKTEVNKSYAYPPGDLKNALREDHRSDERIFLPYSYEDYKLIKPKKYMLFGGLGPNIGNDHWKRANEKKQKMVNYWKIIKQKHISLG